MGVDAVRPLQLGSLLAQPASVTRGWLAVGEDWRRQEQAVPVSVVYGAAPGPTLYLQALSDGNELNGLAVCRRVLAALDPGALRGALVVVLVANPGAFAAGVAADPRDERKLNRCFPGRLDGSSSERLAYHLFHDLVRHCDLAIDLHQNGSTPMVPEVRVRTGRQGPRHAECLELALAFGLPQILDQQGPAGQLARCAPARGIPTIDPELGGNSGIDPRCVDLGVQGVWNVLVHYGLLSGRPVLPDRTFIARRLLPLLASAGGIVEFERELGGRVVAGELVATVTDIFGTQPTPIHAPADGLLWMQREQPLVARGDTVGALGIEDDD
ncbi:MAG: succinylglutamate desuccinylase/aspartoacylase family protein [Fimbriimonadaceae bacterium]|nr:succinylglutamate desuccinylase/aspartoacylase family protein [Fimbriimonadaceae bacterium]